MQLSSEKPQVSENIFMSDDDVAQIGKKNNTQSSSKSNHEHSGTSSVENADYEAFDFHSLAKISDIDIPFFNRLSDMLAVIFPQLINEKFNIVIEIESLKSQVDCYSCFTESLATDTFVVQSQCLTWSSNFLVAFSRKFINGAMNEYLSNGSSLLPSIGKVSSGDRPLSRMGEQFAKSISECCFASINRVVAPHLSLNMLTRYVENNINKAVLVDGREKVIICKLMARVGDQAARPISLVLPLTSMTPYLADLDNLSNLLAGQLDEDNSSARLQQALNQVPFELVASTPKEYIPLQQVTQMKVGDLIPLPNFNQLEMKIIDEVIFKASLGSDGAFHAGLITEKMHITDQD